MPRVRIIIVNYRTPQMTLECLASLEGQLDDAEVVVVDNDSGDDSLEIIGRNLPPQATLLPSPANGGFAYGNNLGIRPALEAADPPDYFLLLNPDTVAEPGLVKTLVDFMDQTPSAGIAGPAIKSGGGVRQHSAFRFPTVAGELERGMSLGILSKLLDRWIEAPPIPKQRTRIDWVSGAAMIIRRDVVTSIGLMDESYFLYYEEVDFCLRAHRAGWSCWYLPEVAVLHRAGASTGVSVDDEHQGQQKRLPSYWFESRRRYFEKNHGDGYAGLADLAYGAGFGLWRLRARLQGKADDKPPKVVEDLLRTAIARLKTSRR